MSGVENLYISGSVFLYRDRFTINFEINLLNKWISENNKYIFEKT